MSKITEKMDGPHQSDSGLIVPDHVLAARVDCSISFLEEGLLPSIRDNVNLTNDKIRQMASGFISKWRKEHPNDFELKNPLDLISIASANLLPLQIIFMTKRHQQTDEDKKIGDLLDKADILLAKILDEEAN